MALGGAQPLGAAQQHLPLVGEVGGHRRQLRRVRASHSKQAPGPVVALLPACPAGGFLARSAPVATAAGIAPPRLSPLPPPRAALPPSRLPPSTVVSSRGPEREEALGEPGRAGLLARYESHSAPAGQYVRLVQEPTGRQTCFSAAPAVCPPPPCAGRGPGRSGPVTSRCHQAQAGNAAPGWATGADSLCPQAGRASPRPKRGPSFLPSQEAGVAAPLRPQPAARRQP